MARPCGWVPVKGLKNGLLRAALADQRLQPVTLEGHLAHVQAFLDPSGRAC